MVQRFRDRSVKIVIGFLKKTIQPLASYSDDNFTCYVLDDIDNSQIWIKVGDPYPVPSGKWMDIPEKHWKLSNEEYFSMPINKRAEMECKEQVIKYIPYQFENNKKEFYHPEESEAEFLNTRRSNGI